MINKAVYTINFFLNFLLKYFLLRKLSFSQFIIKLKSSLKLVFLKCSSLKFFNLKSLFDLSYFY